MENHPLKSPVLRRWYFAVLIASFTLLLLLRLKIFPARAPDATWKVTVGATLDTLIAATVASVAIGLAYVFLFGSDPNRAMTAIDSREISGEIHRAATQSKEWSVRARTASYFSAVTLPLLKNAALDSGHSCTIRIQVLDVENSSLMNAYAVFRSNHRGEASRWTQERVRTEIYRVVLQAALSKAEAPRLSIELGFSPAFWVVSLDLTSDFALLTGQDKGEPALILRQDSVFFNSWSDDFDAGFSECRRVTVGPLEISIQELAAKTDAARKAVADLLAEMNLASYSDKFFEAVVGDLGRHNYE